MNAKTNSTLAKPQATSHAGDPGVGGLLADPLETDVVREKIDPHAGTPSADAPRPEHHHDWSPNKKPDTRKECGHA